MSNYEEAELLEQEKYQEKVAKAVAEGVEEYFSRKTVKKIKKDLSETQDK